MYVRERDGQSEPGRIRRPIAAYVCYPKPSWGKRDGALSRLGSTPMPTKHVLRAGLDIVLEMSWRLVSACSGQTAMTWWAFWRQGRYSKELRRKWGGQLSPPAVSGYSYCKRLIPSRYLDDPTQPFARLFPPILVMSSLRNHRVVIASLFLPNTAVLGESHPPTPDVHSSLPLPDVFPGHTKDQGFKLTLPPRARTPARTPAPILSIVEDLKDKASVA
jgi:hypothetical protein